jgi:hypothetical protein
VQKYFAVVLNFLAPFVFALCGFFGKSNKNAKNFCAS